MLGDLSQLCLLDLEDTDCEGQIMLNVNDSRESLHPNRATPESPYGLLSISRCHLKRTELSDIQTFPSVVYPKLTLVD